MIEPDRLPFRQRPDNCQLSASARPSGPRLSLRDAALSVLAIVDAILNLELPPPS